MAGATGNVYTGLLEFNEMAFILHALRKGDVFADIGANIGVYTILAAKNVGAAVLAVEPGEATLNHLQRNISLNEVGNLVTVFATGVGMQEAEVQFVHSKDAINHVVSAGEIVDAKDCITITVKRLDDLFTGQVPAIMKLDIEGYEWPALKGATHLLASSDLKALIIELNGSGNAHGFSTPTSINCSWDLVS
jgi:FkbM family methyltransferase